MGTPFPGEASGTIGYGYRKSCKLTVSPFSVGAGPIISSNSSTDWEPPGIQSTVIIRTLVHSVHVTATKC